LENSFGRGNSDVIENGLCIKSKNHSNLLKIEETENEPNHSGQRIDEVIEEVDGEQKSSDYTLSQINKKGSK